MSNRFTLAIDNPCSQKWADFEDRGDRGFCSSCQKEVIDFTRMSDSEIRAYFKDLPANVCGKLRQDQIKVYGDPSPRRGLSKLWTWPIAAIATFFSIHTSEAQTKDTIERVIVPPEIRSKRLEFPRHLSGTVRDENGNPLSNVEIIVERTEIRTTSDTLGYYEILVPDSESTLYYSLNEYMVHISGINQLTSGDITLKPFDFTMLQGHLGGISAYGVPIIDFQKTMDRTRELIILLFR